MRARGAQRDLELSRLVVQHLAAVVYHDRAQRLAWSAEGVARVVAGDAIDDQQPGTGGDRGRAALARVGKPDLVRACDLHLHRFTGTLRASPREVAQHVGAVRPGRAGTTGRARASAFARARRSAGGSEQDRGVGEVVALELRSLQQAWIRGAARGDRLPVQVRGDDFGIGGDAGLVDRDLARREAIDTGTFQRDPCGDVVAGHEEVLEGLQRRPRTGGRKRRLRRHPEGGQQRDADWQSSACRKGTVDREHAEAPFTGGPTALRLYLEFAAALFRCAA
jgi:hypothetical protein